MIEVKNLTKRYGDKLALDDISFTVRDGEVLGFLGPNGAGKTTTMNIITGYLSSTAGTVTVDGHEILAEPMAVKSRIGYLPEQPPLYLDMTVAEYLSFLYDLKKVRLDKRRHIEEICDQVRIGGVYSRIIKNLSKGYRQRVGLAQALLGDPGLLILDEPTVGLDPKQIIDIRNLIKELGKKHTVILSSHILPEVQAACERVIVINNGRLLADDSPDNLARGLGAEQKLVLRVEGPEQGIATLLEKLPGAARVELLGETEPGVYDFRLEAGERMDLRRSLFEALAGKGWPLLGLRSDELSLEDIFLQLTEEDRGPVAPFTEAQLGARRHVEPRASRRKSGGAGRPAKGAQGAKARSGKAATPGKPAGAAGQDAAAERAGAQAPDNEDIPDNAEPQSGGGDE